MGVDENTRVVGFGDSNNDRELLEVTREAWFVKNVEPDAAAWFKANREREEYKHIRVSEFAYAAALRHYLQGV